MLSWTTRTRSRGTLSASHWVADQSGGSCRVSSMCRSVGVHEPTSTAARQTAARPVTRPAGAGAVGPTSAAGQGPEGGQPAVAGDDLDGAHHDQRAPGHEVHHVHERHVAAADQDQPLDDQDKDRRPEPTSQEGDRDGDQPGQQEPPVDAEPLADHVRWGWPGRGASRWTRAPPTAISPCRAGCSGPDAPAAHPCRGHTAGTSPSAAAR